LLYTFVTPSVSHLLKTTVSCNMPFHVTHSLLSFVHIGWAKSRYTVIIFFFTGIVNDGRKLKYRTKTVDFEAVLEN